VAPMTSTNSALQHLVAWASGSADDSHHRRIAARWAAASPALAGYASAGEVIRAGWANPDLATTLLAELTVIGAGDSVAVQAALAILTPRLVSVVARWARAGVPAGDLEDMEADLLAETVAALRARPDPQPPAVVVDLAWAKARNTRRRHRRATDRQVALDAAAAAPVTPVAGVTAATVVIDAFRSGRLSLPAAQALWATGVAGWSGAEASARLGCQPAALRARRSRAIRALAA
jgi:DNA-directed RNA polymerase specialized sigma24 family protein